MRKLIFNSYKECFSGLLFLFFINCVKAQIVCSTVTNTASNFNFTASSLPVLSKVYFANGTTATTGKITTSGTINVTNNAFYARNGVSMSSGFKATSVGANRFIATLVACTATAPRQQEPITKDELVKGNIVLFPNPTATRFTSVFNEVTVSSLSIYSIEGKQIYFQEHLEGQKELEVEVAQLPEGIYTVMYLTTQGERIAKKFVKIKG